MIFGKSKKEAETAGNMISDLEAKLAEKSKEAQLYYRMLVARNI